MTWNIVAAGHNKAKVKAHVRSVERLPWLIRDAICAAIDQIEDGKPFVLETAGHLDGSGGNVKFNIRTQQTFVEGG